MTELSQDQRVIVRFPGNKRAWGVFRGYEGKRCKVLLDLAPEEQLFKRTQVKAAGPKPTAKLEPVREVMYFDPDPKHRPDYRVLDRPGRLAPLRPSDRVCLILGPLILIVQGLLSGCARTPRLVPQDAPRVRYVDVSCGIKQLCTPVEASPELVAYLRDVRATQTRCAGHCWSGTYACGYGKRCCSRCQGRCGW